MKHSKRKAKKQEITENSAFKTIDEHLNEEIIIDNDQKDKKKRNRQIISRIFFIGWNIISIIYYAVSAIVSIIKEQHFELLTYIICGALIVYVITFSTITVLSSSSNAKVQANKQTFKTQIKMWRTILAFFNLLLSIYISINMLVTKKDAKDASVLIVFILSILFSFARVGITLTSIVGLMFKQKRINKKKRQIKEKERLRKLEKELIKS